MLASVTRVRGFKPGWSRWIFRASEKSSACLPSEGKWKNLSHVPALRHVKEPSTSVNYDVPSFASRGLLCLCGACCLWRWMRGTQWGKGTIGLQAVVPKRPHTRPFIFNFFACINTVSFKFCVIIILFNILSFPVLMCSHVCDVGRAQEPFVLCKENTCHL